MKQGWCSKPVLVLFIAEDFLIFVDPGPSWGPGT